MCLERKHRGLSCSRLLLCCALDPSDIQGVFRVCCRKFPCEKRKDLDQSALFVLEDGRKEKEMRTKVRFENILDNSESI